MKTITVASQPAHDLATADVSNHSFCGRPVPLVPYPVLTALLPHGLFVLPPTRQACSCLKSLYLHSLWLELGWNAPSSDIQYRLPPFVNSKSLVLSNTPSKHTASRHSPSSHLPFFLPGTYYLMLLHIYLLIYLNVHLLPSIQAPRLSQPPLHIHSPGSAHHTEDTRK